MEFEIESLTQYKEGNRLEFKESQVDVPRSFWETYSSFANTEGGYIVLGVKERRSVVEILGVSNPEGMVKKLWDALNNPSKVSANILANEDIFIAEIEGKSVVVVRVPRANHDIRPVFVGENPLTGTFRRNGEGGYHCVRREVAAMLRDNSDGVQDREVLPLISLEALCPETIHRYTRALRAVRPEHPWLSLGAQEFLLRLGAISRSAVDGDLHPTRAGLLMFGYAHEIVCEFPLYFMEYREILGDARWDDRVVTNDGEWSGNVFDFWRNVLPRIGMALRRPFELSGAVRVDDTPLHKTLREALANALVHADYYGESNTVIARYPDALVFQNPGTVRIDPEVAQQGGISSQRNPVMMTMFNLIGIGERAGAGFDIMREGCRWAQIPDPLFRERLSPDRVELEISLNRVGSHAPSESKAATLEWGLDDDFHSMDRLRMGAMSDGHENEPASAPQSSEERVISYLRQRGSASRSEIEDLLGVSRSTAGGLLSSLVVSGKVVARGKGRATRYQLA